MRNIAIMKTSLLILTALCGSLTAEENLILRALRANHSNVRRARGVSGPSISVTSKPPCPSYITCPYPPYPRPTTKQPAQEEGLTTPFTTSTSEKAIVEYFGPEIETELSSIASASASSSPSDGPVKVNKPGVTNGPSISATSKPPCPSYISCPYPPYPRPTTKPPPREEKTTTAPAASTPDKAIVEYFGPEKENEPDMLANAPVDQSSTVGGPVKGNKPGVTNGPSISATSKPPCPGYITCPYPPYPRPTTKPPPREEKTTTAPAVSTSEKTIVEYFGPEKENPPEMLGNAPVNPSYAVGGPVKGNKPGVTNGPSISATSKPPCPSYITCPYPPYPRPTTKPPPREEKTTTAPAASTSEKATVEYFGPEKENEPDMFVNAPVNPSSLPVDSPVKGNKPGVTNGPSIPATSKPPCPSYVTCPYPPYPKPTTKSPLLSALSPVVVTDNPPVDYFAPETNTSPEDLQVMSESKPPQSTEAVYTETVAFATQENNDNSITTDGQAEKKPMNTESTMTESHVNSVSTEKNDNEYSPISESSRVPSSTEVPDGWHFPGLSNANPVTASPPTDSASEMQTEDLVYSADPAITTVTRRPAISATQKPQCPFYASCPFIYPKPTTAPPLLNKIFSPPSELSSNSGGSSNKNVSPPNNVQTNIPDIAPFAGDVSSQHHSSPNPVDLGNQEIV